MLLGSGMPISDAVFQAARPVLRATHRALANHPTLAALAEHLGRHVRAGGEMSFLCTTLSLDRGALASAMARELPGLQLAPLPPALAGAVGPERFPVVLLLGTQRNVEPKVGAGGAFHDLPGPGFFPGGYHEVAAVVPVALGGQSYNYLLRLSLDRPGPIAVGDLFGFDKEQASLTVHGLEASARAAGGSGEYRVETADGAARVSFVSSDDGLAAPTRDVFALMTNPILAAKPGAAPTSARYDVFEPLLEARAPFRPAEVRWEAYRGNPFGLPEGTEGVGPQAVPGAQSVVAETIQWDLTFPEPVKR